LVLLGSPQQHYFNGAGFQQNDLKKQVKSWKGINAKTMHSSLWKHKPRVDRFNHVLFCSLVPNVTQRKTCDDPAILRQPQRRATMTSTNFHQIQLGSAT